MVTPVGLVSSDVVRSGDFVALRESARGRGRA